MKKSLSKLDILVVQSKKQILNRIARINPAPIFVLGNQKSGTTAIAALLSQLTEASATLDIRGIYEPVRTSLHRKEISFEEFVQRNRLDFSREIVKEPNLVFLRDELLSWFPNSKMLFISRDPRSNIRSILNRLSIPGDLPYLEEKHLSSLHAGWRGTINGEYLGLEGKNYIETLAARWDLAAKTYLENADNITLIRYEDFCEDKVGEIERLARRVGLEPVSDISDMVDHQYQRRGDKNISWREFFGAENLARIEYICGERMEKLGYELSKE